MRFSCLTLIVISVLLCGCSAIDNLDIKSQLVESNWQLVGLQTQPIESELRSSEAYVVFATDGSIHGFSSCNHFRTSYQLIEHQVTISPVAMTRRYCAETAQIEQQLIEVLQQARNLTFSDQQLIISDVDGNLLATFLRSKSLAK